MNAVATKPRVKSAPATAQTQLTQPIAAGQFFWLLPTRVALRAMVDLLDTAVDLDLPEDDTSNYACRVVQVARDLVTKEAAIDDLAARSMARNEVANVAFDVFALLTAALNFPNEPLGASRTSLLEHVRAIADQLGTFHSYGTKAADPGGAEVLPSLQRAIEVAPLSPEGQREARLQSPANDRRDLLPSCLTTEAVAVIYAAVGKHAKAEVRGVHALAQLADTAVKTAFDEADQPSVEQLEDASNALDVAAAVLELVNDDGHDCMLLHAGVSLLTMAKQVVDSKMSEMAS